MVINHSAVAKAAQASKNTDDVPHRYEYIVTKSEFDATSLPKLVESYEASGKLPKPTPHTIVIVANPSLQTIGSLSGSRVAYATGENEGDTSSKDYRASVMEDEPRGDSMTELLVNETKQVSSPGMTALYNESDDLMDKSAHYRKLSEYGFMVSIVSALFAVVMAGVSSTIKKYKNTANPPHRLRHTTRADELFVGPCGVS